MCVEKIKRPRGRPRGVPGVTKKPKSKKPTVTYKYYIILFCNKKQRKRMHRSAKQSTIMSMWHELKTQVRPPYVKTNSGKKRTEMNFELVLIYPMTRWSTKNYSRDNMGRNVELKIDNPKQRIKYIIPYWEEEYIYDFDAKDRIRYHQMMRHINTIYEIAQIFTLNNKLFVQVEDDVKMYGNKNIDDANRLFDIVREELLRKKKTNFIFVKDISTHQRVLLYDLLENKGYKRRELFRHYSY